MGGLREDERVIASGTLQSNLAKGKGAQKGGGEVLDLRVRARRMRVR